MLFADVAVGVLRANGIVEQSAPLAAVLHTPLK